MEGRCVRYFPITFEVTINFVPSRIGKVELRSMNAYGDHLVNSAINSFPLPLSYISWLLNSRINAVKVFFQIVLSMRNKMLIYVQTDILICLFHKIMLK